MTFRIVPAAEATASDLRADLLATWVAVTDAGGSVGFAAPAPVDLIAATLDRHLAAVAQGRDLLGVLVDPAGKVVGMGLLVSRGVELFAHWRTVLRLMVHPDHQGAGAGRVLLDGLHGVGRDLGLDHLQLTVRSGSGLQAFYARFGYEAVGVHPRAVRMPDGTERDEVMMVRHLVDPRPGPAVTGPPTRRSEAASGQT